MLIWNGTYGNYFYGHDSQILMVNHNNNEQKTAWIDKILRIYVTTLKKKSKLSLAHLSIIVILSNSLDTTCALIGSNLSFILPIKR